jgi:hypothetical protein
MNSDRFSFDDKKKVVSLIKSNKKKRLSGDGAETFSSKKARLGNEDGKTGDDKSTPLPSSSMDEWRKENKIVIKHAKDDEEGMKQTERINKDPVYYPFDTFDKCSAVIDVSLIRQCTDGHGFQKPSPIQAQAWPILMHKKRDVVGIAETGSGKTLGV